MHWMTWRATSARPYSTAMEPVAGAVADGRSDLVMEFQAWFNKGGAAAGDVDPSGAGMDYGEQVRNAST